MVGKVITKHLQIKDLSAGSIAILLQQSNILGVVTVTHLNKDGDFVVEGEGYSGTVTSDMTLNSLIIMETSTKHTYPLKFSQWPKALRADEVNTDVPVSFKLQYPIYVSGHYHRVCVECESHFMGHKRQPICENCCKENPVGQIILTKAKPKPASEVTVPTIPLNLATLLFKQAFKMGAQGMTYASFEKWLKTTLSNGVNKSDH